MPVAKKTAMRAIGAKIAESIPTRRKYPSILANPISNVMEPICRLISVDGGLSCFFPSQLDIGFTLLKV